MKKESLLDFPTEVWDGLCSFETAKLWTSGGRALHLQVFDCGIFSAILMVRSDWYSQQVYRRELAYTPFHQTSAQAIRWCKQFIRDWCQCEADDQEEALDAAWERGDFDVD